MWDVDPTKVGDRAGERVVGKAISWIKAKMRDVFRKKMRDVFRENRPCEHCDTPFSSNVTIEQRCLGASLSWAATVVPIFEFKSTCVVCGHKWTKTGYIPEHLMFESDRKAYYPNGDFWPVDPKTKERLPIWECRQ